MRTSKIKIGDRFGRLTVIDFVGHNKSKNGTSRLLVKCKCDCGNIVIIRSNNLHRGTKSCGCYHSDIVRERCLGNKYTYKHGGTIDHAKLYKVYISICQRYKNNICDEWRGENGFINFMNWAFANGYNESYNNGSYDIKRIDSSKQFCPENCECIDTKKYINYNGNNYSVSDWCYVLGRQKSTVSMRMKNGDTDPAKILKHPQKGCINAIYFVDENERPINQQDYANGIRVGRKAY